MSPNKLVTNALQNLLFCILKAAVLHGKSVGFASQKSHFRNAKAQLSLFNRTIFTKSEIFRAILSELPQWKTAALFHFHQTFLHISQTISSATHNKSVLP